MVFKESIENVGTSEIFTITYLKILLPFTSFFKRKSLDENIGVLQFPLSTESLVDNFNVFNEDDLFCLQ